MFSQDIFFFIGKAIGLLYFLENELYAVCVK